MGETETEKAGNKPKRRITAGRAAIGGVGHRDHRRDVRVLPAEDRRLPRRLGRGQGDLWPWIVALLAATALNLATFAPPWMVALPGLRFRPALMMTQASTALSMVAPGRRGGRDRRLVRDPPRLGLRHQADRARGDPRRASGTSSRTWRIRSSRCSRSRSPARRWHSSPRRRSSAPRSSASSSQRSCSSSTATGSPGDIGDAAARLASWVKREAAPGGRSSGTGASFERFRRDAVDLLGRRWHALTLATLAGSLTVFLVLVRLAARAPGPGRPGLRSCRHSPRGRWRACSAASRSRPGGIGVVELEPDRGRWSASAATTPAWSRPCWCTAS